MLAGTVGHVAGVPHPQANAGLTFNSDMTTREMLSGQRMMYRAPTTYQSMNLSWKCSSQHLAHLFDLYEMRWGTPHFWIQSPFLTEEDNILPLRWSVGHQLAHVLNGLGEPSISGNTVKIVGGVGWSYALGQGFGPSVQFIVDPGKPYYFGMTGTSTGLTATQGVVVYGHKIGTPESTWARLGTYRATTTVGAQVLTKAQSLDYDFLKVAIELPSSRSGSLTISAMELSQIDFSTTKEKAIRRGKGIGAVQMSSELGGSILSKVIDRIGFSADLMEVDI